MASEDRNRVFGILFVTVRGVPDLSRVTAHCRDSAGCRGNGSAALRAPKVSRAGLADPPWMEYGFSGPPDVLAPGPSANCDRLERSGRNDERIQLCHLALPIHWIARMRTRTLVGKWAAVYSEFKTAGSFWSYNDLSGRTEGALRGTQPYLGISWRAHRDDGTHRRRSLRP